MKHVTFAVIFALSGACLFCTIGANNPNSEESRHAQEMVSAEFGYGQAVTNAYFSTSGLLQGVTCYYRFETTTQCVQSYIAAKTLIEIPVTNPSISVFKSGSPSWWVPGSGTNVHYYGWSGQICIMSWDAETGRCYIKRSGG
jgi:hypothetical protein